MESNWPVKRALVSVSDKEGIVELCKFLDKSGVEIISTGGTRDILTKNGIESLDITSVTGSPEAFNGRMKTLSFNISSALLFRRDCPRDLSMAKELDIEAIDLVICNLYPFLETVQRTSDLDSIVENIDIGGPTMLRAAAKNYKWVTTICSPDDYDSLIENLTSNEGTIDSTFRKNMAAKAFQHTSRYEIAVSEHMGKLLTDRLPSELYFSGESMNLRYGENAHQSARFLGDKSRWETLQGKELSYNNILDADAAYKCCLELTYELKNKYSCTIIKHSNPCGVASSEDGLDAITRAWNGDKISAFGSILCINDLFTLEMANFLSDKFVEVIIAKDFSAQALELLSKKKNIRVLKRDFNEELSRDHSVRDVLGGLLIQKRDCEYSNTISKVSGDQEIDRDLFIFGQITAKYLMSNAISLVQSDKGALELVGAGMGNPNRFVSISQAVTKAKENGVSDFSKCLLTSDAFFPFKDSIEFISQTGLRNIVQPGGSIRDEEVISASKKANINMYFTGMRHFRH
ncbi:putative bifunctional purine biosynthesis protein PurH [Halobacteriovorax marinus SJ]|uniref:Bifunctional purine biosynthesis protein PurH n=1 Tax=Halobacteriovorax marinus (strain ATCC BAA-682 / DSM 15412 / SJ) TaxID=862908 RepID=E1X0W5_HALMS|nr:bifunctional phosphoribosylaminoimidazolecarboxamide formyltransferase/IMP cyclohydrolase [Halobacteriovorax marinus]CBW26454.1 putative bifunctional purine biosynthesis protein PurH [Halobacteriovorax marinus SJ]